MDQWRGSHAWNPDGGVTVAKPLDLAILREVFADPPYEFEILNRLPSLVFQSGVVSPDGYLIIEHPQKMEFETSPLWQEAVVRKYGRTVVTFFESQHEAQP